MTVGTEKVAIITGGSGGMGLAVAKALAARGGWQVHILDIKEEDGRQAAGSIPRTTFHRADLLDYDGLAAAFKAAFTAGGSRRLDFVFANAGTIETPGAGHAAAAGPGSPSDEPPPPPDFRTLDVNLKGAISTVHLARHYLKLSSPGGGGSIVITASSAGIWPTYWAPTYTASKFGLVGFMRTVAHLYKPEGIRVNALCPGCVRTPILPPEGWSAMPEEVFSPLEFIAEVVLKLAGGDGELVDSRGVRLAPEELYGQAVVSSGRNCYVHGQPEFYDDFLAKTFEVTKHMEEHMYE